MSDRELILVLGKTGSGKTQWTKRYLDNCTRYLALDYNREYAGLVLPDLDALAAYLDRHGDSYFRVTYARPDDFPAVCDMARIVGDLFLVLEEADRFWSTGELDPEFNELIERGRHQRVSLLSLTRFPAECHINVRRQATQIITFEQHEPADLKWLRAVGFDPEEVRALGRFEYLHWTQAGGISRHRLDMKERELSCTGV